MNLFYIAFTDLRTGNRALAACWVGGLGLDG